MNKRFRQKLRPMIKSGTFEQMTILESVIWMSGQESLKKKEIIAIGNAQRRGEEKRSGNVGERGKYHE